MRRASAQLVLCTGRAEADDAWPPTADEECWLCVRLAEFGTVLRMRRDSGSGSG